ncbi:ABC transporter substrate-binding protein [Marinobacter adhaerens]|uniref:ABC transporter substrate-binding protein n=1 Tax=Marinobacter adhaerens TaxID=1033846 RepID=UPI001E3091EA|nr:ABC transporter substrate binding protein [Marinobacter adhaerens]MCD1647349.1 hypothetical protein [Marinobacter adhaerens]
MRLLFLALLLVSPLCFGKTVVIIQSYHLEYKWDADYIDAVRSVLGEDHDIHVFELDTKRLSKPEWPKKVAEIQSNIADINPDVAILGDDNAFTLMADHLVGEEIPVVFLGVNGGPVQHPTLEHPLVTGILERPFFSESIRHLRKILRQKERFLVLMDDSPTMRNAVNEYFGDKRQATIYGSELDIVLTNDKDTWLNTVVNAHERYDAVVLGTHHTIRDKDDQYVIPHDLLKEAFYRAQLPLFSFWDIFVGEEQSIGGFTISAKQEGLTAARLASLILNGVKPDRIPHLKSLSGHYVYSESGLAHWNLQLSPLIASQANFVE